MAPKVTDITFKSFSEKFEFSEVDGWRVYGQDLNKGAKKVGKYIYIFYRT